MCKCHKEPTERFERAVERLMEVCGHIHEWGGDLTLEPSFRHRYHFPSLDRLSVQRLDEVRRELYSVLAILSPDVVESEEDEHLRHRRATKVRR